MHLNFYVCERVLKTESFKEYDNRRALNKTREEEFKRVGQSTAMHQNLVKVGPINYKTVRYLQCSNRREATGWGVSTRRGPRTWTLRNRDRRLWRFPRP